MTIDEQITNFLKQHAGRKFGNSAIAQQFGMETTKSIKVIQRLMRAEIIRPDRSRTETTYYYPTQEQLDKINAPVVGRVFKPYQVPQAMLDVMARVQAERESIKSHYGQAA